MALPFNQVARIAGGLIMHPRRTVAAILSDLAEVIGEQGDRKAGRRAPVSDPGEAS